MRSLIGAALLLCASSLSAQTTITPLPTPPTRTDPANFSARADAFLNALPLFGTQANAVASETRAARDAAAASADTAVAAPGTNATSATNSTPAIGTRYFSIQTGKALIPGQFVIVASAGTPFDWMNGQITSYNSSNGDLIINSSYAQGTGAHADWNVALSTPVDPSRFATLTGAGFTGAISAKSAISLTGTGEARVNFANVSGHTPYLFANSSGIGFYDTTYGALFSHTFSDNTFHAANISATGLSTQDISARDITGRNVNLSGTLTVSGATTLAGAITGNTTFSGAASFAGGITGNTTFGGNIGAQDITGRNIGLSGTLTVGGAASFAGGISGNTTFTGDIGARNLSTTGTLGVGSTASFGGAASFAAGITGNVTVTGAVGAASFSTSGSSGVGTTLTVGGAGSFGGHVTAPAFDVSSDRRLKTDIAPIDGDAALTALSAIGGKRYIKLGAPELGVIAQDVQAAGLDAIVATDAKGYLSVNYNGLVAELIAAVARLSDRVKTLEAASVPPTTVH